tara:strand:+ start:12 stop:401 length:390 start_codon:yes stop_codon:yes gene_type:complete
MKGNGKGNGNGDDHQEGYQGKSDHEVILILETQVQELIKSLNKSERQNDQLTKTQGQISVVRLVFVGVMGLIFATVIMTIVSWWSPKAALGLEKELQFYERLLLVMMGILSSATVALYDQRSNGKNGDG